MPWSRPRLLQLKSCPGPPSFILSNLKADDSGRFAVSCGTGIVITRKAHPLLGATDYNVPCSGYHPSPKVGHSANMDVSITDLEWWPLQRRQTGIEKRPVLVVATAATQQTPPGLNVLKLNTSSKSTSTELLYTLDLMKELEKLESPEIVPTFFRGLAPMWKTSESILFTGTSEGQVLGFAPAHNLRDTALVLRYKLQTEGILTGSPIMALAVDKSRSPYLVAADESGTVAVWDSVQDWEPVYVSSREHLEKDCATAIGIRDQVILCGHASGCIEVHRIDEAGGGRKLASLVLCNRTVTSIDMHPLLDLALVGGEDGKVAVVALPATQAKKKICVLLSLQFPASVLGVAFSSGRGDDVPDIAISLAEREYIIQFEYDPCQTRATSADLCVQDEPALTTLGLASEQGSAVKLSYDATGAICSLRGDLSAQ